MPEVVVLKRSGLEEKFNEDKLIRSLQKSKASEEEIEETVGFVKSKLKKSMTTGDIYALAYKKLNSIKKRNPNAIRYSLKRSILELGPTGFPFEKFVARIYNQLGYKCNTGVVVQGNCIEHEIDILAYNETDVICIEAKFHNEPHLKSDTKVALYVKARFDDLIGQNILIGDKNHKITKGVLITNTTFTDTAYTYVDCVNTFELVSWNRPKDTSLLYYIENYNLYPISVIRELNQKEIDYMLSEGIMTCLDVYHNPQILNHLGMKKSKQAIILETIAQICNI